MKNKEKLDKRRKYFWQGEPVKAEFGICCVDVDEEKPLMWYNFECHIDSIGRLDPLGTGQGAAIDAIRVTCKDGESFIIANHFGIGAYKLKAGGWPNCTHFSFPKDSGFNGLTKYHNGYGYGLRDFDEEGYSIHEAGRRKWQKKHFPKEFKGLEGLKKMARGVRNKSKEI